MPSDKSVRFSVHDAKEIEEPTNSALVRALARVEQDESSLSVTWVTLHGHHAPLSSSRSSRLYFVLSGQIAFAVGDNEHFILSAEEGVVIPRGERYSLEGSGTYLVANTPAFRPGDDVYGISLEPFELSEQKQEASDQR